MKLPALSALVVGLPLLGLAVLAATTASWLPHLESGDAVAAALFLGAMTVLCGLACLTAQAATLVAGYAFGWHLGAPLALVGVSCAGQLGYSLSRLTLHRGGPTWPPWQRARAALLSADRRTQTSLVALLRLAPIMPFSGTNLLMGSTGIGRMPFLLGTLLGFAPIAVMMAMAGATLAELRLDQPPRLQLWLTLVLLSISVVGLGWLARRRLDLL